jgi:uncharacterized protein (DUF736 family)
MEAKPSFGNKLNSSAIKISNKTGFGIGSADTPQKEEVGAMWCRVDKNGYKYLSVKIGLNLNLNITFYPNTESGEKLPDYKGFVRVESGKKEVAAIWNREDKNGNLYYRMKIVDPQSGLPRYFNYFSNNKRKEVHPDFCCRKEG